MPTQKYRVDTDKGSYEVEVEVPEPDVKPLKGTTQTGMIANSMLEGAKGFAKGVVPGAYHAVIGAVPSLVQAALGTVKGTANLLTDPVGTLTDAYEAVKGVPGKGADVLQQALDLARKDPEAFGKQVGELTGASEVGIAASKAIPLAPKPVARAIGSTMEQVGTKGKWPIRMMGAHQLGSGNPMGVATMMLPEALEKGGGALQDFGGGVSHGRRADIKAASKAEREAWSMVDKEKATAAKTQANTDRLAAIERAKAERVAGKPAISETVSAETPEGGKSSMTTKFTSPEEAVDPEITALKKQGYDDATIEKILKTGKESAPARAPIRVSKPAASRSATPEDVLSSRNLNFGQNLAANPEITPTEVKTLMEDPQTADTGKYTVAEGGLSAVIPNDLEIEGEEGLHPAPISAGLPTKPGIRLPAGRPQAAPVEASVETPAKTPSNLQMGSEASPEEITREVKQRVMPGGIRIGGRRPIQLVTGSEPLSTEAQGVFDQYMAENPDADPKLIEQTLRKLSGQ